MLTPRMGQVPPDGQLWAGDTGRFNRPEEYTDDGYLRWLTRMLPYVERCLFVTAPDVVGDAVATFALSAPMYARIRELGYPVALVAQDGIEDLAVPWDDFDALFIGGTTKFKTSEPTRELCLEAKRRGKWVHMGRVNSHRRMRVAAAFACDSVDGTKIAYGPDQNEPKVRAWLADLHERPSMWREAT